ncbi:MAG: hypothetical protein JSV87_00505 [Candidatus Bathyarchaeota archaeon]|nr:MAG: hypothetical protein JSV87_00505 [Candidatus Bathyarchaeota archaeon]
MTSAETLTTDSPMMVSKRGISKDELYKWKIIETESVLQHRTFTQHSILPYKNETRFETGEIPQTCSVTEPEQKSI